jgi:hypothetical protein
MTIPDSGRFLGDLGRTAFRLPFLSEMCPDFAFLHRSPIGPVRHERILNIHISEHSCRQRNFGVYQIVATYPDLSLEKGEIIIRLGLPEIIDRYLKRHGCNKG